MIAVLTCYFNPNQCQYRFNNYQLFKSKLAQCNVDVFTIEMVFGVKKFELDPEKDENLVQVRGKDVMFQKERLLNILLEKLDPKYDIVVWMDCDLIFFESRWADNIKKSLEKNIVCQCFSYAVSLPKSEIHQMEEDFTFYNTWGSGKIRRGFVKCYNEKLGYISIHKGHIGYVWAARRDFIQKHKFYDPVITGAGDLFMGTAFIEYLGLIEIQELKHVISDDFASHYFDWAIPVATEIYCKVGHADNLVMHLWHGDINKRNYLHHCNCLKDFNPREDLIIKNGLYEWNSDKPKLHKDILRIFESQSNGG